MGFVIGAAIIGGTVALAGGITSGIAARSARKQRDAQNRQAEIQREQLAALEASRPEFENPFKSLTNQFESLNNPYTNLTVATKSFELQAEQADMALANSLDVMMETGMGAGGATALAQAALQSKKGIAASINAQETQNNKLAAQGEANVQMARAKGAADLDLAKAKGDAMEQQDAIGFHEAKMNRAAGLMDNAMSNSMQATRDRNAAIIGIGNAVSNGVQAGVGAAAQFGDK